MALHNLKIVVVDGGRAGSYKEKNAGAGGGEDDTDYKDTPLYKLLNAKETIKGKVQSGMSPVGIMAMNMGMSIGSQLVKQTANYYLSDIGRRNGDSNYQARIERQIEAVTDPLSVLGGIGSGAAAGSMFGPWGAAIGAAVGGISSVVSLGFKYADRERTYQHEMFKNNTSQAYALARSSFQGFTGRLR